MNEPADIDRELLRFGTGEQHAVIERVKEPLLTDPAALLHQLLVHQSYLTGRATEGCSLILKLATLELDEAEIATVR